MAEENLTAARRRAAAAAASAANSCRSRPPLRERSIEGNGRTVPAAAAAAERTALLGRFPV